MRQERVEVRRARSVVLLSAAPVQSFRFPLMVAAGDRGEFSQCIADRAAPSSPWLPRARIGLETYP